MKTPCNLIFHGATKQLNMGEFESIAAAKRYVKSCDWLRPYTIVRKDKYLDGWLQKAQKTAPNQPPQWYKAQAERAWQYFIGRTANI